MNQRVKITVNQKGNLTPTRLFDMVEDGVRRRLPKLLAKDYHDFILKNIDTNRYGFILSESWLRKKELAGWGDLPFVAEGHYREAIKVFTADRHLTVGFPQTKRHPRSGLPISRIAAILEFGNLEKGLPARPLWRRTSEEFFEKLPNKLKKHLFDEL